MQDDGRKQLVDSDKKPSWDLIKSRFITAAGNFGVQYSYVDISWSGPLWIKPLYGQPGWASETENSVLFVGTIVGMLGLGFIGDIIGRNHAMCVTIILMVVGNAAAALLPWGDANTVWALIVASRFIFGVGAGGVYPLAANKAAEDTGKSASSASKAAAAGMAFFWRNPAVLWNFLFGYLLALGPGAGATFGGANVTSVTSEQASVHAAGWQWAWRLHLGFGVLPLLATLPSALKQRAQDSDRAGSAGSTLRMLKGGTWLRCMLGTGGTWASFNFSAFGTGLIQPLILQVVFPNNTVATQCWQNVAVSMVGVAFTLLSIPLMRRVGAYVLQLGACLFSFAIALILAACWQPLRQANMAGAQFFLYCIIYGNFWVLGVTSYVLPSLVYEKEVRSTLNGISSVCGKIGAILGSTVLTAIYDGAGPGGADGAMQTIFYICSFMGLVGAACTYFGLSKRPALLPSGCLAAQGSPGRPVGVELHAIQAREIKREAHGSHHAMQDGQVTVQDGQDTMQDGQDYWIDKGIHAMKQGMTLQEAIFEGAITIYWNKQMEQFEEHDYQNNPYGGEGVDRRQSMSEEQVRSTLRDLGRDTVERKVKRWLE